MRVLCIAATGFAFAGGQASDFGALRPWSGPGQPSLSLQDLSKTRHALSDYRGRPVIVHFFATWCAPCLRELPALAVFAARHPPPRLTVLAVDVGEPDLRVKRFFEKRPVPFPVLLDSDRAAARAWGVDTLPTTFMLDADLLPRFAVQGEFDWAGEAFNSLMPPASRTELNHQEEQRQ